MSLMNGEESIKGGGEVAFDLAAAGAWQAESAPEASAAESNAEGGVAADASAEAGAEDGVEGGVGAEAGSAEVESHAEAAVESAVASAGAEDAPAQALEGFSRSQSRPQFPSQSQPQFQSQPQPQQFQAQSHPAVPSSRYAARAAKREQEEADRRDRDEAFMRLAVEEARRAESLGEVPIGAVVVYEPIDPATRRPLAKAQVIARACNLRETTQDPAGHAEFLALKQASEVLGVWRLTGCTVYVTLEPCLMCAGLMQQSRVDRCVFGAADPKAGALGSLYQINEDVRLNHTFEVQPGILADDCAALLRGFFAAKRKKRTEQNRS